MQKIMALNTHEIYRQLDSLLRELDFPTRDHMARVKEIIMLLRTQYQYTLPEFTELEKLDLKSLELDQKLAKIIGQINQKMPRQI